MLITDTTV